jgi:hypothetical protein
LRIGIATFAIAFAASISAAVLDIQTLSTRPDRVSGGDVLVQITQDNNTVTPVVAQRHGCDELLSPRVSGQYPRRTGDGAHRRNE